MVEESITVQKQGEAIMAAFSDSQVKDMLDRLGEDTETASALLVESGVREKLYEEIVKMVMPKYPLLWKCILVMRAMGGPTAAGMPNATRDQKIGIKANARLISQVAWKKIDPEKRVPKKNSKTQRKAITRGPISVVYQAYQETCDKKEMVPNDEMCALLMRQTVEKIAEYRGVLSKQGYKFEVMDCGMFSVSNPRKAKVEQIRRLMDDQQHLMDEQQRENQRKMDELRRQLIELEQ